MNELRGLWRGKRKMYHNNETEQDVFEWAEGYLIKMWGKFHLQDQENENLVVEVDPSTCSECTGLRDKNGTLIFEGDIFRFGDEVWSSCYTSCGTEWDSWEVKNYGVVGFDEECARFDFVKYKFDGNSVEKDLHENRDIEFAEFVSNLEIVGNIHDNPELLEGEF